jgi:hypothetical protein
LAFTLKPFVVFTLITASTQLVTFTLIVMLFTLIAEPSATRVFAFATRFTLYAIAGTYCFFSPLAFITTATATLLIFVFVVFIEIIVIIIALGRIALHIIINPTWQVKVSNLEVIVYIE